MRSIDNYISLFRRHIQPNFISLVHPLQITPTRLCPRWMLVLVFSCPPGEKIPCLEKKDRLTLLILFLSKKLYFPLVFSFYLDAKKLPPGINKRLLFCFFF